MKNKQKEFIEFIKKNKTVLIVIISILVFLSIIVIINSNSIYLVFLSNQDAIKIKKEYESLNSEVSSDNKKYPEVNLSTNNKMVYTSINKVLDMFLDKKTGVVFIGHHSCLYSRNAIEVLNEVASKTDLETIYYLKVEDVNDKKLKVIFTYLDEDLMTDKEILNIPIVLFIVDGKVISYNQGTLFSQRDPYIELDEFQIQGLSEIYYYGINDVISWENLKKK